VACKAAHMIFPTGSFPIISLIGSEAVISSFRGISRAELGASRVTDGHRIAEPSRIEEDMKGHDELG
jgi:hypothetical protein